MTRTESEEEILNNPTVTDVERILRTWLAGRSMVFELGLNEDEFRQLRRPLLKAMRTTAIDRLARQCPASFATYMAYTGAFLYDGGDYWSSVHPHVARDHDLAGESFIKALRALNLEAFDQVFEQEAALRWVTRFLAQGGIPQSCLEPFVDLIVREVDAGVADGESVLETWRKHQARLGGLHAPTRRFLLYGGPPSVDLIDRAIELVRDRARLGRLPDPADAGLPAYIVQAFDTEAVARAGHRRENAGSFPTPAVRLDPYDGLGPVLELPRVPSDALGGRWRVYAGDAASSHAPSSYSSETVQLPLVQVVEVEFLSAHGVRRTWTLEVLPSTGVLAFDPESGARIRDRPAIAARDAWLMLPVGATVAASNSGGEAITLHEIEAFPVPVGDWNPFEIKHLDLNDVARLSIHRPDGTDHDVRVVRPRALPRLRGQLVEGTSANGELPVYVAPPELVLPLALSSGSWTIQLWKGAARLAPRTFDASQVRSVQLAELLDGGDFGVYRVRARGGLGSDLTTRFAVAPGLTVDRPTFMVAPGEPAVVNLSSPYLTFKGRAERAVVEITDPTSSVAHCQVSDGNGEVLDLAVSVPRLLWTLADDQVVQPSSNIDEVGLGDDRRLSRLILTTGKPGVVVQPLLAAGDTLVESPSAETAGEAGRWTFNLGGWNDVLRQSSSPRFEVRLRVGAREFQIARLHREATFSFHVAESNGRLRVTVLSGPDDKDRVLRLWSQAQPWTSPVEIPIDDGVAQSEYATNEYDIPPGKYLAEVTLDDGWSVPQRPSRSDPSLWRLTIRADERNAWMEALPADDPLSLLTRAVGGSRGETDRFGSEGLVSVAGEAALALAATVIDIEPGGTLSPPLDRLFKVLGAYDAFLVAALLEASELEESSTWLDRIAMRLLPALDPKADPVPQRQMEKLWATLPTIACALDLPWVSFDADAAERSRLAIGWERGRLPPQTDGAQAEQLHLVLPVQQLRDLRFTLGLDAPALLNPEYRTLAMFDTLIAQQERPDDPSSPREWFARFEDLRGTREVAVPAGVGFELTRHLDARAPKRGAEAWGAVPAVLLGASVALRWGNQRQQDRALLALECALPWATRFVRSDGVLLSVLEFSAKEAERAA